MMRKSVPHSTVSICEKAKQLLQKHFSISEEMYIKKFFSVIFDKTYEIMFRTYLRRIKDRLNEEYSGSKYVDDQGLKELKELFQSTFD